MIHDNNPFPRGIDDTMFLGRRIDIYVINIIRIRNEIIIQYHRKVDLSSYDIGNRPLYVQLCQWGLVNTIWY